ncbi:MAG: hypothetical protein Q3988_03040 [Gemella sp.]|nr:hypothetical protein [Gemella sp.]
MKQLFKNLFIGFIAFWIYAFIAGGISDLQGYEEATDVSLFVALILAILTPFVTTFFSQYNYAMSMKHSIAAKLSDIKTVEERSATLLEKFDRAIREAREHELKMHTKSVKTKSNSSDSADTKISEEQLGNKFLDKDSSILEHTKKSSVNDTLKEIEYSNWKPSTEEQAKLLDEIRKCTADVANFKISHNEYVSAYNMTIYKMPLGLLRNALGLKEEKVL